MGPEQREAYFKMVTLRAHGFDLDGFAGRLRWSRDGLSSEIKWDAEDVGVLDVEKVFFVEIVRLASKRAADDLLAKELGAEGADAKNMGNSVRVPAFSEHRDGYDAAD
jgi:hypothetical protein